MQALIDFKLSSMLWAGFCYYVYNLFVRLRLGIKKIINDDRKKAIKIIFLILSASLKPSIIWVTLKNA